MMKAKIKKGRVGKKREGKRDRKGKGREIGREGRK